MAIKNGRYISSYLINIKNESPMNIAGSDNMPLINEDEQKVYIPGTTLAGAFRAYLKDKDLVEEMFGNQSDKSSEADKNSQSKIFIYDSFANLKQSESRPAVKIDYSTGTNTNKMSKDSGNKFERYFVGAGHEFEVRIEIYANDNEELKKYEKELYKCIAAIDNGDIRIGSYKSIGAGVCKVIEPIKKKEFNLNSKEELFRYLKDGIVDDNKYENLYLADIKTEYDSEDITFILKGELRTPLLIKGYSSLNSRNIESEQMVNAAGDFIIPGSSLKGVIRNEVINILMYFDKEKYIEDIFGTNEVDIKKKDDEKKASRITTYDCIIDNPKVITYNKIKVDRFTGGVRKGALTSDKPVKGDVTLEAKYKLAYNDDSSENYDLNKSAIASIALVFRDICIGNVPLGGGNSIGRGRIEGKELIIKQGNKVIFEGDIIKNNIKENILDEYINMLTNKEVK